MSEIDMRLVVDRYDVIVTQPGSDNVAVYFKGVQNAGMGNGECEGPRVGLGGVAMRLLSLNCNRTDIQAP
jgi:hypothetical protein